MLKRNAMERDRSNFFNLWLGLTLVLTLIFILSVYNCGKEIYMYKNGTCVEATLPSDTSFQAKYNVDGKNNYIEISRIYNKVEKNKVDVYYLNNTAKAMPLTLPWIWGIDFSVMIGLYILFISRMYKEYKDY